MDKNSKILVFGSSGFVGKNLIEELIAQGYKKVFGVNRSSGNFLVKNQVLEIVHSINPEHVFICAAKVGGIKENMENNYQFLIDNLTIQNNIISTCIGLGVKKVLNLGSSCIYPKDYKQPLKEEYLLQAPLEPTNEGYALAKIAALKLCEYANKDYEKGKSKTRFISLMPSNLYGPGDSYDLNRSHVLSALIKKIVDAKNSGDDSITLWGSGKARREFLYIRDLCDGMIWSMDNLEKTDTFLNIGTGEDISIIDLAKNISEKVGFSGEIKLDLEKPDGMLKKCMDITKIKELGWKPKTNFKEGIGLAIADYLEND